MRVGAYEGNLAISPDALAQFPQRMATMWKRMMEFQESSDEKLYV